MLNPVVQVIDDTSGDIVYTLRIRGTTFHPKVFSANTAYTIKVGEPGAGDMKVIEGVEPIVGDKLETLKVDF
jgi:alkaline phosphatase D